MQAGEQVFIDTGGVIYTANVIIRFALRPLSGLVPSVLSFVCFVFRVAIRHCVNSPCGMFQLIRARPGSRPCAVDGSRLGTKRIVSQKRDKLLRCQSSLEINASRHFSALNGPEYDHFKRKLFDLTIYSVLSVLSYIWLQRLQRSANGWIISKVIIGHHVRTLIFEVK